MPNHSSDQISKGQFSIIGHEKYDYFPKVKERLFIRSMRPNLNGGEGLYKGLPTLRR